MAYNPSDEEKIALNVESLYVRAQEYRANMVKPAVLFMEIQATLNSIYELGRSTKKKKITNPTLN